MLSNHVKASKWKKWKWIAYGSLALPYLVVYFHRVAINVVSPDLMTEFNISGASVGMLAAMYFYIYTILQIPSGVFADFLGPRKTAFIGMIVATIGSILFALASYEWVLFAGRILISLGVSVIFISILKIQSEWFLMKEFALLTGITVFIGNAGAVMAATPLAVFVNATNWRTAFYLMSALSLVAAIIIWKYTKDSPKQLGISLPDQIQKKEKLKTKQTVKVKLTISESIKLVLNNRWSWIIFIAYFGIYGSFLTFQGVWGVPYFMHVYEMSKETAANHLLVASVGHMIGSISVGYLSDHVGRRKPIYLGFLTILTVSWAFITFFPFIGLPVSFLYPLSFLIGFSASCFILTWGWSKEVNNPQIAGIAMGTTNMAGFLGAAILQPLFGFILDLNWNGVIVNGVRVYSAHSYMIGFLISLVLLIISTICIAVMKETYNQNIYSQLKSEKGKLQFGKLLAHTMRH